MLSLAPALPESTDVGLPGFERVRWGTHLCHFYRTAEDLESILVPYFAAGLGSGERCLWITADPLRARQAERALAQAVPDLAARVRCGQLEVLDYEAWYLQHARLTTEEILARWLSCAEAALRDGWQGLRLTGNTSWLRAEDWARFDAYERQVHAAFARRRVLALCSYSLERCTTDQVLDVVRHHGVALARRNGSWAAFRGATETLGAVAGTAAARDLEHDAIVYRGEFPAGRVARWVGDGLRAGEAVVVVVGGAHGRALREALEGEGLDLAAALRTEQVLWLDPEETLPTFLRDGAVDRERFDAVVPPLFAGLRARWGAVRVYGELVDLLSRRGDFEGALALERVWNAYLRREPTAVLCTYDCAAFDAAGEGEVRAMAAEHRHLHAVPHEAPQATLAALVSALADRTQALETEASRRSAAERERDRWMAASRDAHAHVSRLQRVTSALLSTRSTAELGVVVATTIADATGASRALIAAANEDGALELVADSGGPARARQGAFSLAAGSPIAEVLRSGRPLVLGTREALEARWPRGGEDLGAFAALPLETGTGRPGVLAFGFSRPQPFSPVDRALLDDVASQASLALERTQLVCDLERARERAETASRAKDEFLAMLGHELRNPLSPMVTVLHLMQRRAPDAFRKEREILERQLRHMEHLVNDLLDVARIAQGKLALQRERVELGRVVADALEAAGPLLQARGHEVRVQVPLAGLALDADPHRLVQAVLNLLNNAAKYTPAGGHVDVRAEPRARTVLLHVADDGQGIEPELAPHLFDLFVQGPRGLARSEGGLGLGLAIARSVVEMHGGTIRVRSAGRGKGSTFTVELPLAPARVEAAPEPSDRRPAAAPGGSRVLVVDDNLDAAETLADALRVLGHDAVTAHDPEAALDVAAAHPPEVAILDIGLPGMDGWALGALLRERSPDRPPHCIAVTGYGMESDRARSREAGFVAHLVKPVDLERLGQILTGLSAAGEVAAEP
ncbi:MAG TPA: MEDS domain-containing protein [Anaeromyxobacter sp.]|nr:MEDS domain-containing protein [Anaeromyxobacter sp.]